MNEVKRSVGNSNENTTPRDEQDEKSVCVRVPATSANLGPGFDCLGISLELYSEFTLTLRRKPILTFELQGDGVEKVSRDERNIVWQAVKYLLTRARANREFLGAHLKLDNKIPLSRGLGSSASAIVGGLKAANALLNNRFSRRELLQMATDIEGHPDNVAPAIFGGVTVSTVDRGRVHSLSFLPKIRLKLVVSVPDFTLATRLARQALPEKVSLKDAVFNIGHASMLVAALCRGNESFLRRSFADALHQPYRAHLIPGLTDVIYAARHAGALGAALSGAGPTVIAFVADREQTAAQVGEAMKNTFAKRGINSKIMILNLDPKGAHLFTPPKEKDQNGSPEP